MRSSYHSKQQQCTYTPRVIIITYSNNRVRRFRVHEIRNLNHFRTPYIIIEVYTLHRVLSFLIASQFILQTQLVVLSR